MKVISALFFALILLTWAMPVVAVNDIWYLKINTDDPSWAALKTLFETKQAEINPGSTLSVAPNLAGTEAVVKILGATSAWRSANSVDITHDAISEMHEDNAWALILFRTHVDWKWPEP